VPIYEYKCANGHTFEAIQRMADDPLTECEECGAAVERVFHPVAVHFKGSGFYTTDYGSKSKTKGGSEGGSEGDSKSDGGGDSKPAKGDSASGGDSKSGSGSSGEKATKSSTGSD
jgi:putative FmdB family regulatory protein